MLHLKLVQEMLPYFAAVFNFNINILLTTDASWQPSKSFPFLCQGIMLFEVVIVTGLEENSWQTDTTACNDVESQRNRCQLAPVALVQKLTGIKYVTCNQH